MTARQAAAALSFVIRNEAQLFRQGCTGSSSELPWGGRLQAYQHLYLGLLYGLLSVKSVLVDDFQALASGSIGSLQLKRLSRRVPARRPAPRHSLRPPPASGPPRRPPHAFLNVFGRMYIGFQLSYRLEHVEDVSCG